MFAPLIKTLISSGHLDRGKSTLAPSSHRKPDKLFAPLDRFEAVGDNNMHVLWFRAERAPLSNFMNRPCAPPTAKPFFPISIGSLWDLSDSEITIEIHSR